ncbi:hypothetical protein SteCoe_16469 [Stentor coeruleus]|uniref:Uncharacterized protein n=1 Tax=Stentor coeruleus TaxID=5963 RepID=A0A1R2C151_9CILI|nr:hypothetical protein SteCoe_16469 [Stentor coeruleus]
MTSVGKYTKKRNLSMQNLPYLKKTPKQVDYISEDLQFLSNNGFISQRYLAKSFPKKKIYLRPSRLEKVRSKVQEKLDVSFTGGHEYQNTPKHTINLYEAFKEYMKPCDLDLNYLCPNKLRSPKYLADIGQHSNHMAALSNYKQESMRAFKNTNFRLRKAKEYIKIAKRLSNDYNI